MGMHVLTVRLHVRAVDPDVWPDAAIQEMISEVFGKEERKERPRLELSYMTVRVDTPH